jgi:histidinol dehydrogenase
MTLSIAPAENHREREKGVIVYPVYSRRAGGLSVGINLFPDKKSCPFDCPYCEVFPFSANAAFSLSRMEEDLRCAITSAAQQNTPVKDICFSGNGEPSLSPALPEALKLAEKIRLNMAADAELVLITNGAGLLQPQIFSLLLDAAVNPSFNIWLKLDAGTDSWYKKINRAAFPFEKLSAKIKEFASCAKVTIQTMLCAVDGSVPPPDEEQAWEKLTLELAAAGRDGTGGVRKVQIYGKARPAPEDPKTSSLPDEYFEQRAASLRDVLKKNNLQVPVEVYI